MEHEVTTGCGIVHADGKEPPVASGSFEVYANGLIQCTVRGMEGTQHPEPIRQFLAAVHVHNTERCRVLNANLTRNQA